MTVVGSTITGNTAVNGAGINAAGTVELRNSTVSDNTATNVGGGMVAGGAVDVVDSTISDNHATDAAGGGIAAEGPASVVNSTVTGNSAGTGGGIAGAAVTLVYATVASNFAPTGANVAGTDLMPFASAIVLPTGGGANCDLANVPSASAGHNFSDDTSCRLEAGTDFQDGGDPDLGDLAANGGPTETRLPEPTSPLLDVIPTPNCRDDGASDITTDQRGITRPQALFCDIGSVEVALPGSEPPPSEDPTPPSSAPPAATPSSAGPPVSAAPAAPAAPIPATAVRFTG